MSGPRIWLIGCGNMAGAMLSRWLDSGVVAAGDVDVVNTADRTLPGDVRQGRDLPDGDLPDLVMIGVKPQQIDDIAARFGDRLAGVPAIVSILAGVDTASLAKRFDTRVVVRAMPNLPVAIGRGVVSLHASSLDDGMRGRIDTLMAPLGLVEWIDEALFDAATALAGSGPGFVYRFIDALAAGGAELGLPADQALRMARATVEGSAVVAAASDEAPGSLADKVASRGGSTREGLDVLDRDDALVRLVAETLEAARRRNAEMAAAAR